MSSTLGAELERFTGVTPRFLSPWNTWAPGGWLRIQIPSPPDLLVSVGFAVDTTRLSSRVRGFFSGAVTFAGATRSGFFFWAPVSAVVTEGESDGGDEESQNTPPITSTRLTATNIHGDEA